MMPPQGEVATALTLLELPSFWLNGTRNLWSIPIPFCRVANEHTQPSHPGE